jgi:hypothetical protein
MITKTVSRIQSGLFQPGNFVKSSFLFAAFTLAVGFALPSQLSASYTFSEIWAFYSGPGGACPN